MTVDIKYPIGKHQMVPFSQEEKEARLADVLFLPRMLEYAVLNLNDDQIQTPYREGGWTVNQVIHHVADSHMNAYVRTKHIITQDQSQIQPYDENAWASSLDADFHHEASYLILLGLHQKWSLLLLESLKDAANQLVKTLEHPESGRQVSLSDLIRHYAWHGTHHLEQIKYALTVNN